MTQHKDFGKRVKFTIEGTINSEGALNYGPKAGVTYSSYDDRLIPGYVLARGSIEYMPDIPKAGEVWENRVIREHYKVLFVTDQGNVLVCVPTSQQEFISGFKAEDFHNHYTKVS